MLAWGNSLMTVESCQLSTCAVRSKPSPLMMHLELAREQRFHFMITLKVAELIFFLYWNENKTFWEFCQNVFEWKNTFLDQKDQVSVYSLPLSLFLQSYKCPPAPRSTRSLFHKACQPQQSSLVWRETSAKGLSSHSRGSIACKDITSRD